MKYGQHPKAFVNLLLVGLVVGILLADAMKLQPYQGAFFLGALVLLLVGAVLIKKEHKMAWACLWMSLILLGAGRYYLAINIEENNIIKLAGQQVKLQGKLAEPPNVTRDEKGKLHLQYVVEVEKATAPASEAAVPHTGAQNKTFILFSDDLDKTLATFVLANGAAATGKKVSIFFTFWGLNAIKKVHKPKVEKDIFGRMFGWMLPSDSTKLALSKMNMMGIGAKMMRHLMKKKGVDSLESLRQQAIDNGVEFIACQMSMDVMGVKREELLDNVTIGGVASYMERAEQANVNLFI